MVIRARKMLSDVSRPTLRKHARLQYDPIRRAWAVLAPEKVFWPDETSLGILQLCDGNRDVEDIVSSLARDFDADPHDVRDDVREFLQTWSDRALVSL